MAQVHFYRFREWRLASGYDDPVAVEIGGQWTERDPDHQDRDHCPDCPEWRPRAEASRAQLPVPNLWPGFGDVKAQGR